MDKKTKFTPTEVLSVVDGIKRNKLYAMMANGQISYEGQDNKRLIDASELLRVFGSRFRPQNFIEIDETNTINVYSNTIKQDETSQSVALYAQKNQFLEERIAFLEALLEKERNDFIRSEEKASAREKQYAEENEKLIDTIKSQTILIQDMRPKKKRWWIF
jgi:hypothetical protein